MTDEPSVIPVPCLSDNYAYLVFDPAGQGDCLVVDPSEAGPVRAEVKRRGLRLQAIINTHHHWDHVGGNHDLISEASLQVVGFGEDANRIPGLNRGVLHRETFELVGLHVSVRHVPGHTLGAAVFSIGKASFTGDTLFCAGCGRLFEGTAAQMHHSLTKVLGDLPGDTQIYCGHEYTTANLEFAQALLPCVATGERLQDVRKRRAKGEFCASASLATERATNPFLRCHLPEVQEALGSRTELEAFAELRRRKDRA